MYINLILGLMALAALVWLALRLLRRAEPPSKMLLDEISRRRLQQEEAMKGLERLEKIRAQRLDLVEAGLADMSRALEELARGAGGGRGALLQWQREAERILLRLPPLQRRAGKDAAEPGGDAGGPGGWEELVIRWDVKDLDMELLAAPEAPQTLLREAGEYSLRWSDGGSLRERELSEFMRAVSGAVADRLNFTDEKPLG